MEKTNEEKCNEIRAIISQLIVRKKKQADQIYSLQTDNRIIENTIEYLKEQIEQLTS